MAAGGDEQEISAAFTVSYCGFSVLDFNYSSSAFRWIVGELIELVPFGQEEIELTIRRTVNGKSKIIGTQSKVDFASKLTVLDHDVDFIWKFFPWTDDARCFAYLVRTDPDFPFTCHVFHSEYISDAQEILKLMRVAVRTKGSSSFDPFVKMVPLPSVPSSPCLSSMPESSSFTERPDTFSSHFEVHYLCRVEINGSSPSSLVVDEAARKYEEEYKTNQIREYVAASVKRLMAAENSPAEDSSIRTKLRFSIDESDESQWEEEAERYFASARRKRSSSLVIEALVDSVFLDDGYSPIFGYKKGFTHASAVASPSLADMVKARASSNRSMLMIIGRNDISLISLDHKQELLKKKLTEISCVIQGSKYSNHFAFVCPDNWQTGRSDCFVIRCQDSTIATTAIRAMRTAFTAAFNEHASAGGRQHVCERCPLYQFSCLCTDIEGLKPRKIHDVVVKRISQLPVPHQEMIWSGYKKLWNECSGSAEPAADAAHNDGTSKESISENVKRKNIMLMSVLRSVCESAQVLHSRSVGKLFNGGSSNAGGLSTAASVSSENEIYLIGTESCSNSTAAASKPEKADVSKCGDVAPFQRFSATNKLVSLRDKARNAFGGSLDSFIKKLNNNDTDGKLPQKLISETTVAASEGDQEDDSKPRIVLCDENYCIKIKDEEGEEMNDTTSSSPTPLSPSDTMATSRAKFHFETPDRRGSDTDIYYRPRSSTVGDVFLSSARGRTPITSKFVLQDKHTPLAKHGNSNDRSSNSSLVNMAAMHHQRGRRMSWRQAIFTRVVSPRFFTSRHSVAGLGPLLNDSSLLESRRNSGTTTTNDSTPSSIHGGLDDLVQPSPYKSMWKKAIMEQILTLRLEHQKKAQAERESEEIKKMKLNYEEITPCSEDEARPVWLEMLRHPKRQSTRFDRVRLEEAVKAGVPKDLRCEVWKFLMSQHMWDRGKRAQMEIPPAHRYCDLLKDLTSYQHAILIDLGRTFPSHNYFSQPLGPGQLSLFNILKAYSLFDMEVGYCQGLSFIAGVLLLHMEEEDAFEMLVDMMYRLQLRKQYRPDMLALQIEMYQVSRLLHDRHKDLHLHLEEHEIPILYAAPWFLTLFASAFPLGFVARVFDFVFLAGGLDVVFKIALTLLGDHKELIKNCDSFESINDFLKTTLPAMSIIQMERVFNQVFELDVTRELLAYEVEYHVIQEEVLVNPIGAPLCANASLPIGIPNKQPQIQNSATEIAKLDNANKFLKRQNMELLEQLQDAHYKLAVAEKVRLEMDAKLDAANDTVNSCQCKINGLETRIAALEMERRSLLAALQRLRGDATNDQKATSNSTESQNSTNNGIPTSPHQPPSSLPLNRTNSQKSNTNLHSTHKMHNTNGHHS